VRARHQHFVALIEQRAQHQVDELAHAVADEDFLGRDAGDAPGLLLHDDRFARREDALLVAVPFCLRQVLDHGESHGLRRTQAKGPGVADVERDDLVALALELVGTPGEAPTDLVTHMFQAVAGADTRFGHHGRRITAVRPATVNGGVLAGWSSDRLTIRRGHSQEVRASGDTPRGVHPAALPTPAFALRTRAPRADSGCGTRSRSAATAVTAARRPARVPDAPAECRGRGWG